jgi:hypothetical protein
MLCYVMKCFIGLDKKLFNVIEKCQWKSMADHRPYSHLYNALPWDFLIYTMLFHFG